jgi:hypothetical protein
MTTVEDFDKEVTNEIVALGDAERSKRLAGEEVIRSVQGHLTATERGEGGGTWRKQETELGSDDKGGVVEYEFGTRRDGGEPE